MKGIPLTQGKVALVDDEDYEAVSQHRWFACRYGLKFYAKRNVRPQGGRPTTQFMHILIAGVSGVDHQDGDGLNNTRGNLRAATKGQNSRNQRPRPGSSSGYVGVTLRKTTGRWIAQIATRVDNRRVTQHLGTFAREGDAARARDKAAFERDPEFCYLNFPEEYGR